MNTLKAHSLPLPTPQEMRHWDAAAIAMGLPELLLMENAARTAFDLLCAEAGPLFGQRVLIFMGSGNNGGDAACLARHLSDAGALPLVLHTKALNKTKGAAGQHARLARRCEVPFVRLPTKLAGPEEACLLALQKRIPAAWHRPHIVVDGLLGTGFTGPLRPDLQTFVRLINTIGSTAFILALDVPSGCNALTGKAEPLAVQAHATLCFAAAKPGLVLPQARSLTGRLHVRGIGIPRAVQQAVPPSFRLLTGRGTAALLPTPPPTAHKNTFGHVLVVGGSPGLTGAAHLTALAALRSGAGLVTVAAPAALCAEIKCGLPEAMTLPLGAPDTTLWPSSCTAKPEAALLDLVSKASALALGPGMGVSTQAIDLLKNLLTLPTRPAAVLDADALNILALRPALCAHLRPSDILTPHPGEAARLLQCSATTVQRDRVAALRDLAALSPATVVLKGAGTMLTCGQEPIYILPHDIATLAVAGSGDVLGGCAAALLATGMPALPAAALAVVCHARAGDLASRAFVARGNLAGDVAALLPAALASLSHLPEVLCADPCPAHA